MSNQPNATKMWSGRFRESLYGIGVGLGVVTAAITLFAERLTSLSGNIFIASIQMIAIVPALPGLFGAALIGNLGAGAAINLIAYSLLGLLLSLIFRQKIVQAKDKEIYK